MKFNDAFNEKIFYAMHPDLVERSLFKSDFPNTLSKDKLDKIFYNTISAENTKFMHTLGKSGHKNDNIKYEYNTLCYRGKEFEVEENLLIAGCSQTFGMGVEESDIWGNKVAEHFGVKASNLSIPGASTESIINNIFAYFKEYGHPKVLLALFPDMYRFQIPTNRESITSFSVRNEDEDNYGSPYLTYLYLDMIDQEKKPKYQKLPFDVEQVLTPDIPFFHNMKSIIILNQYCNAVGIKFYWASWRDELDLAMTKIKLDSEEYKNYIPLEFGKWYTKHSKEIDPFGVERNLISSCKYHREYALDCSKCYNNQDCDTIVRCHSEIFDKNKETFDYGNDRVHMGSHKHQHIAESFIERIKNEQIFS